MSLSVKFLALARAMPGYRTDCPSVRGFGGEVELFPDEAIVLLTHAFSLVVEESGNSIPKDTWFLTVSIEGIYHQRTLAVFHHGYTAM
jgi:hypothetical protein